MTDISAQALALLSPLAIEARDLKDALRTAPAPEDEAAERYGEARAHLGAAMIQLLEIDRRLGAILTKAEDEAEAETEDEA
jgi:hypothetical protein